VSIFTPRRRASWTKVKWPDRSAAQTTTGSISKKRISQPASASPAIDPAPRPATPTRGSAGLRALSAWKTCA
jgi:hypothetical protein